MKDELIEIILEHIQKCKNVQSIMTDKISLAFYEGKISSYENLLLILNEWEGYTGKLNDNE